MRLKSGMTTSVYLVYAMHMKRIGMTRKYGGVLSSISLGTDGHRNQTRRRVVSLLATTIVIHDCYAFSCASFELKVPPPWRICGDHEVLSMVSLVAPKTKFSVDLRSPICTAMNSYERPMSETTAGHGQASVDP